MTVIQPNQGQQPWELGIGIPACGNWELGIGVWVFRSRPGWKDSYCRGTWAGALKNYRPPCLQGLTSTHLDVVCLIFKIRLDFRRQSAGVWRSLLLMATIYIRVFTGHSQVYEHLASLVFSAIGPYNSLAPAEVKSAHPACRVQGV